jgi:hypothetical protein
MRNSTETARPCRTLLSVPLGATGDDRGYWGGMWGSWERDLCWPWWGGGTRTGVMAAPSLLGPVAVACRPWSLAARSQCLAPCCRARCASSRPLPTATAQTTSRTQMPSGQSAGWQLGSKAPSRSQAALMPSRLEQGTAASHPMGLGQTCSHSAWVRAIVWGRWVNHNRRMLVWGLGSLPRGRVTTRHAWMGWWHTSAEACSCVVSAS